MDLCYGGLGIYEKPPTFSIQERVINYENLKKQVQLRARNIIAAGKRDEEAIDGLFVRVFKQGVEDGTIDENSDGYITSEELGYFLKTNVSRVAASEYNHKQTPQFGSIKAERGEVVFVRQALTSKK